MDAKLKAAADAEAEILRQAAIAAATEAKRLADIEAQKKIEAAAEAQRKAQEVEAQKKIEAEAEAQRKAQEAEAQKKAEAEAEAQRKAQEAEAAKKAEAEAARKAEAEAEAQRKAQEAEAARKAEAEADAARKAQEAEAARKAEAEAEAARKAEAEAEAARKAEAEAEAQRKAEAEAEAQRKAQEVEAQKKAEADAKASEADAQSSEVLDRLIDFDGKPGHSPEISDKILNIAADDPARALKLLDALEAYAKVALKDPRDLTDAEMAAGLTALAELDAALTPAVRRSLIDQSLAPIESASSGFKNSLSPKARQHILHGDGPGSGGHLWPGQPGKTTFPQDWTEAMIIHAVSDILTSVDTHWLAQTGSGGALTKSGAPARWRAWEVRDGVRIRIVYEPATGEVITAFPDPDGAAAGTEIK